MKKILVYHAILWAVLLLLSASNVFAYTWLDVVMNRNDLEDSAPVGCTFNIYDGADGGYEIKKVCGTDDPITYMTFYGAVQNQCSFTCLASSPDGLITSGNGICVVVSDVPCDCEPNGFRMTSYEYHPEGFTGHPLPYFVGVFQWSITSTPSPASSGFVGYGSATDLGTLVGADADYVGSGGMVVTSGTDTVVEGAVNSVKTSVDQVKTAVDTVAGNVTGVTVAVNTVADNVVAVVGAVNTVNGNVVALGDKIDGVKNSVDTVGGKVDGVRGAIESLVSFFTGTGGTAPTVNTPQSYEASKGGSAWGTPGGVGDFGALIGNFVNNVKAAPMFSSLGIGDMSPVGSGNPVMTINTGRYGVHEVDFSSNLYSSMLPIIKLIVLLTGGFVSVRSIILRR